MKKYLRYLAPVLIAGIFCLAVYLLYHKLSSYSVAEIRASMDQIPTVRICICFLLTIVNYIILVGYDWLALKTIHRSLPLTRVGLVSVVGQAVSYNFGALLGGTSVRVRFYSVWGFSLQEVLHLILILAVTFWIGALGLSGLIFIVAPPPLPQELIDKMPLHDVRLLGYVLAGIALAYMVLCFSVRKPVHAFGKEIVFPSPRIAVAQMVVSWVDLICAAACMWVLLPPQVEVSFVQFLPGYLMAQVAVVLTHIPGGVGVFELIIIHLTYTPHEQMVFAAVLIFRLIYYILPLLVAAMLLGIYEIHQRRGFLRDASRRLSLFSPLISSFLTFAAGLFLLISSTLPTRVAEIGRLAQQIPEFLIPAGHLLCAVSGCLLLFTAHGLRRRKRQAFFCTLGLLVTGIVGALLKGFSWQAALMAAVALVPLYAGRSRFYRRSSFLGEPVPFAWLASALVVIACNFALGWAIYHTAWGKTAIMSFDGPVNATRVRLANIAIAMILPVLFCCRRYFSRKEKAKRVLKKEKPQLSG